MIVLNIISFDQYKSIFASFQFNWMNYYNCIKLVKSTILSKQPKRMIIKVLLFGFVILKLIINKIDNKSIKKSKSQFQKYKTKVFWAIRNGQSTCNYKMQFFFVFIVSCKLNINKIAN